MLFRVLGPLEVRAGSGWTAIGAPKLRAVLAALVLAHGEVVSTERLVEELWGTQPPPRARKQVSKYVHELRGLAGDPGRRMLVTRSPGYQLLIAPEQVDAGRFEEALAAGRTALENGDAGQAGQLLRAGLAWWRGPALADVPPGMLVTAEADRLDELRLVAVELRVEADLAAGGAAAGLAAELRALLADHPLRERLWYQLMRMLWGDSRPAEALEVYARAQQVLAEELGADPGPRLQELHQRILAGDPPPTARRPPAEGNRPGGQPRITDTSGDKEHGDTPELAEVPASPDCPYPGLAAFGPQDAGRFFGREQATAALLNRLAGQLARPGLLMVVGPSGSGKSSLLRAGLLPAIAAGALPARGAQAWPLDLMTPGRSPLLELATRIAALAGVSAGELAAKLRTDPTRITAPIRRALLAHARHQAPCGGLGPGAAPAVINEEATGHLADGATPAAVANREAVDSSPRLVLIVDQFEEVFTQCPDEQERRAFIAALCAAAGAAAAPPPDGGGTSGEVLRSGDAPAMVVLGIRADFYARTAGYLELVPYLEKCQVLGPMDQAGLRAAIEKPAASAGLVVEAGLAEVLMADLGLRPPPFSPPASAQDRGALALQEAGSAPASPAGGSYEAGRLPLLAYALAQTWAHREGQRLTIAAYRATGGIDGAVAHAAEAVYQSFFADGKQAAQRLLLRLVSLGEGTVDTRRRVTMTELTGTTGPAGPTDTTWAVLTDLVQARLLTATRTDSTDTVEISHEALLSAWPRLRQWLTDDREGLLTHRDLTDAAHAWQAQDREPSHLFGGTRLAAARKWADQHNQDLNPGEQEFLAASQHGQQRTTRRRRLAVAALALLTLLSLTAAGIAIQQRSTALTARDQAIANQIAAEARQLTATDPSLAAQLDVAANQISSTPDSKTRLIAAATTPLASRLTGPTNIVFSVAFSPDGRTLAAGSGDHKVWLWNLADPARPTPLGQPLTGPTEGVNAVAFSPDGKTLAAGSGDHKVWLWNLADPARPTPLGQPLTGPTEAVGSVAFSPDGKTLAAGSGDHKVWLWNLTDPARPTPLGQPLTGPTEGVNAVAFSPDGKTLAAGSGDHKVWLWNLADPARPTPLGQPLTGPTEAVGSVAFSPDGKTLAAGSFDHKVWRWNLADPARPTRLGQPLTGPTDIVGSVAFSPDGKTLAAGSIDHKVWRWNLTDPARPTPLGPPLTGPTSPVYSVAFSPDGKTLAAGSADHEVWRWNLPSNVLTGPSSFVDSVAFSPDGKTLAAGSFDHKVWLWNLTDPARPTPLGPPLTGPTDNATSVAFSPDGKTLAAGSYDHKVWLWNLTDPARPTPLGQPLTGPTDVVHSVAFSPDGKTLAAGSVDHKVWRWNLTDPARPTPLGPPLTGPTSLVYSVAFSPDGTTLAAGSYDHTVWRWNLTDPARPTPLGPPLTGPTTAVHSVAFSPDGKTLAAGTADQTVWLWNLTDPARPTPLGPPLTGPTDIIYSVAFSPDGKTLAAGSGDHTVWLWNLTDPAHPTPLDQPLTGPTSLVYSVAFSPDGKTLAAGSGDHEVWLWDLDVDDAIQRICATTSNTLTPAQWKQYIPQLPYSPPCTHPGHYGLLGH